jgi:hypothetical protein
VPHPQKAQKRPFDSFISRKSTALSSSDFGDTSSKEDASVPTDDEEEREAPCKRHKGHSSAAGGAVTIHRVDQENGEPPGDFIEFHTTDLDAMIENDYGVSAEYRYHVY